MADDETRGESDGPNRRELTPAERALARRAASTLQRSLGAQAQFQIPRYTFSEPTIRAIANAQRQRIDTLVKPLVEAHLRWQNQVSSDLLRLTGTLRPQLDLVAERLAERADFGFDRVAKKFAEQWASQQSAWLKDLGRTFERLKAAFFPSNLRDIEGLGLESIEAVALMDGIGLYEAPRAAISKKILLADSSAKRREILGRYWEPITADCRASLEACSSLEMAVLVKEALRVVKALEGGHTEAAQSLTAGIADTLVVGYLGQLKPRLVRSRKNTTPDAYGEFHLRQYIAFAPIWQAFTSFHPEKGDPVPFAFNRHATVHSVGTRQFSRRSAVQGLLLVCGILRFLDERLLANEAEG